MDTDAIKASGRAAQWNAGQRLIRDGELPADGVNEPEFLFWIPVRVTGCCTRDTARDAIGEAWDLGEVTVEVTSDRYDEDEATVIPDAVLDRPHDYSPEP